MPKKKENMICSEKKNQLIKTDPMKWNTELVDKDVKTAIIIFSKYSRKQRKSWDVKKRHERDFFERPK